MKSKTCEECIQFWAETYGDGYHNPRITEYGCNMEDEDEDILDKHLDEEETTCPYYNAGDCDVCNESIGKGYVYLAYGPYGDFKCCSEKCQKEKKEDISSL